MGNSAIHNHQIKEQFIVSPVNGIIESVTEQGNIISIRTYIPATSNHNIFSPKDGVIIDVKKFNGEWTRQIFKAFETKIARLTLVIDDIDFWIEVGKPFYITNRIKILKNKGDQVKQGENIGEILLGSLTEIHLDKNKFIIPHSIKEKTIVKGGKSILAYKK